MAGTAADPTTSPGRLWWWAYAVLTAVLGYGHLVRKIITDTGGFQSRLWPPVVMSVVAVGLIGAIRGVPLLRRRVWILLFWALAVGSAAGVIFGTYFLLIQGVRSWGIGIIFMMVAYAVPAEVLLYRYVFRRPEIWEPRP